MLKEELLRYSRHIMLPEIDIEGQEKINDMSLAFIGMGGLGCSASLYSALSGFAIQGVNLTKLQSYPEKNSFTSYFFLCDLDGHIEDKKVQKSLEELGLHCEDFHVLGVFEADKIREK